MYYCMLLCRYKIYFLRRHSIINYKLFVSIQSDYLHFAYDNKC